MKKMILILGLILSFNANAKTDCPENTTLEVDCWPCGSDCVAYLSPVKDENNQEVTETVHGEKKHCQKLTVTGEGEMTNYKPRYSSDTTKIIAPWVSSGAYITDIEVDGVSTIGDAAFYGMSGLKNITLSEGIVSIGSNAIVDHPYLTHIELPQSLQSIGSDALSRNNFSVLVLPENLTYLGGDVISFNNSENVKLYMPESILSAEDGISKYALRFVDHSTLHCPENYKEECKTLLQNAGKTSSEIDSILKTYKNHNGQYFYKGKFYASLSDFASGHRIKKRIYTIEEANQVAGKVNSVKIRYR